MPSSSAWTYGLVARLLPHWRSLAQGNWPRDPNSQQGYKGKQTAESGGFEHAVEASADFWLAVQRLRLAGNYAIANAVVDRYWEGRTVPYKWNQLVEAVCTALR